ncbi:MAG: class I SAM-dependent methyltransferase [Nitrospina sp.]|jgi:ubiquinone/menaquinone biosynthesis C-methylase UbiE|nr:class I SAM-dependent methyltransferase [Nitrospina sp.]MBT6718567.1 class I SAM-dependent methyltransferase [Nitrospina sp.]
MKKILISDDSPFLVHETRKSRWAIPYHPECLNARIDQLLTGNLQFIQGKRILDVGSHMGTFAYAALESGSSFIHGIDTEEKMIERGMELFQELNVAKEKYSMTVCDAIQFLETVEEGSFDTVLCLGMLYYTTEPYRLLKLMLRAAKETVIIDTFTAAYAAIQGKDAPQVYKSINEETLELPILLTALTQPEKKDYTLPHSFDYRSKDLSLITLPSATLLEIWFQSLDAKFTKLDWSAHSTRPCTYHDLLTPDQKKASHWADVYTSDIRVSYLLHK